MQCILALEKKPWQNPNSKKMAMQQSLLHKMKLLINYNRQIFSKFQVLRQFSTAENPRFNHVVFVKHQLYQKLLSVKFAGESVSNELDNLSKKRSTLLKSPNYLVDCVKKLRTNGHYQLCYEILEWMNKGSIGNHSNHALRLEIIHKAKGIEEAEKYFENLHPYTKDKFTYGALFYCYCCEKMTDRALAFFEEMDEVNYANNDMVFGNLMCLYLKVDQPEKVPPLLEEMKRRNIRISSLCYEILIQSYACLNDLEGVEQVINEIQEQVSFKDNWGIYCNIASVYIKAGQHEKADSFLKKVERILDNSSNFDSVGAYSFLISLYATLGDLEAVLRTWDKLKNKFGFCNNMSYLSMLNALTKLDNIEHLKNCFEEWNSKKKYYDVRLPTVVISAYLRHDMFDEAKLLLKVATKKAGQKIWAAHVPFMEYYLRKREIDSALRHLEVALANQWPWQRLAGKVDIFFKYFIEEKDVIGAEQLCRMLEKVQPLVSSTYLGLLKTYAAAEKTTSDIRQRMMQDGVIIGMEHEELLQKLEQQSDSLKPTRWDQLLHKILPLTFSPLKSSSWSSN